MMKEHIVYQKLETNDFPHLKSLIQVYVDVFEMEDFTLPADGYLQTLLHRESLIFFVAMLEEKVIGGLTAHVLPSVYFASAEIYIYDLAVQTTCQRKGIGKNLMASLSAYCKERGYREIFVQADLVDQHAMDFYQATGGKAERVVHYSYAL